MSDFQPAIDYVLPNEGDQYTDRESDRGCPTKFGLTKGFIQACGLSIDPEDLTLRAAIAIYREFMWNDDYETILDQGICNYIFDMAVHHGAAQTHKLVQRACWACGADRGKVKDDGVFGPLTIASVNANACIIMAPLRAHRDAFMRLLVEKYPANKEFLLGWLNRVYRVK
jgi:lysozyme family protein